MRYEQIPINKEIIIWARNRAGYSVDELSKKISSKYPDWERGRLSPSYNQIEQMADIFCIPVAVFFFPDPPHDPPINETFRTLKGVVLNNLPPKIRKMMRKAKAFQLNIGELCAGSNPSKKLITRDLKITTKDSLDQVCNSVRDFIGVSVEQQISWKNSDIALKNWRDALHRGGIFVFKDAFHDNDYSGFCLYDDEFPVIYINNSFPKTRQIFSLFHELAHLLFNTSGIDKAKGDFSGSIVEGKENLEILCNTFAAEILFPKILFEQILSEPGFSASESKAEQLAERYSVSRELVYRKFLDNSLITRTQYEVAADKWINQTNKGGNGGDFYRNQIAYLGQNYIHLALSQYYQNRINRTQLAEYLNFKPKNLDKLEEYLAN